MEYWVSKLREQAAQIIADDYVPGVPAFSRAPFGMADLSSDLDDLAQLMASREAARKALAREAHHLVKNNLQIITSLLEMQASRVENPAVSEALGQTRARIGALALINRLHFEQNDVHGASGFEMAPMILELCARFRRSYRNRTEVAFSCRADPLCVPLDDALPLALFAVEAVTNAYAHAFPDRRGGKVELDFGVDDTGQAILCVKDDGVGFSTESNGHSMGRRLMQGFAMQLGGTVTIESSAAGGTSARLAYRPRA